jgi:peptidoglycan L-alanyl-D-glutamate endopeptidase CwlK
MLYPKFDEIKDEIVHLLDDYLIKYHPQYRVKVTETFRTAAYQNRLWRQGRTAPGEKVTNCDGYIKRSNHQSSLAFDIAFSVGSKLVWDVPQEIWDYYGHLIRKHGMVWGGDWKSFKDLPHCEWPTTDKDTYIKAREWQTKVGLR